MDSTTPVVRLPQWAYDLAEKLRQRVADGDLPPSLRRRMLDELGKGSRLGLGVVIGLALLYLDKRLDFLRAKAAKSTHDAEQD